MADDLAVDGSERDLFDAALRLRAAGYESVSGALKDLRARQIATEDAFEALVGSDPDPTPITYIGTDEDPHTDWARDERHAGARLHHFDVTLGRFVS